MRARNILFALVSAVALAWFAPACEPDDGLGDCGLFGETYCEEIVGCCDFVQLEDPQGEAAGLCVLDRELAQELANGSDPNSEDCLLMMDEVAYQEACFSCPESSGANGAGQTPANGG